MRVLVTGAGGFIGRALCRRLRAEGHAVWGTTRRSPLPEGVEAGDPEGTYDLVFNLAADVDPRREPALEEGQRAQLQRTLALARTALARGARFVQVGTCEEYGDGPAPFREDQPARPVSPYSAAKLAATEAVLALHRAEGLRATVVRPFLTYGPGQAEGRLIPSAIAAALDQRPFLTTPGLQRREVNHVEDIARGITAAAAEEAVGELINIGGGEVVEIRSLILHIFAIAGADPALIRAELPYRTGEHMDFRGEHQKARALLHFSPIIPLSRGLEEAVAHARRLRRAA